MNRRMIAALLVVLVCGVMTHELRGEAIALGDRRELLVDGYLIERQSGTRLRLHEPRDEGVVLSFDKPWEGAFSGYVTVIRDADVLRVYYRGKPTAKRDGEGEVTCVAESRDGIRWTRPSVGDFSFGGSTDNNIVLDTTPLTHNFSPLLDTNPSAPPSQRYKALGGTTGTGLVAFVSADGLHWRKLREEPVLRVQAVQKAMPGVGHMFDSQNLAFWSAAEGRYVMYFRVFKDKVRRIARAESDDFVNWRNIQLLGYRGSGGGAAPLEHLYTSQTHPYFRAPHIYVALAARFMPGRQVLGAEEAKALGVNPGYFRDTSDAVFMTTRGGDHYDRTFLSGFIRPGIGARNWVSRTNYPALNTVQTGEHELSIYVNQDYAQPTAHLRRYSLRLDGFASLRAEHEGGEMVTKPLVFAGKHLALNFATSAAGGVKAELQDESGRPIPGFTLEESVEAIGNEIERVVRWKGGDDVSKLAGKPVRLRLVMKDADVFALRFAAEKSR